MAEECEEDWRGEEDRGRGRTYGQKSDRMKVDGDVSVYEDERRDGAMGKGMANEKEYGAMGADRRSRARRVE